ncbi:MAG: hypothetical protein SO267_07085 [Lachnospiraceae bacterium]|nr:hypothetical protein [Lachnospiraceae bacterium]
MKTIQESEMNFGKFDEADLFHIENSKIYKELGSGIKTVEFILKYDEDSIIFLEAKKSCPNIENRYESEEKEQKFEEYYSDITGKFMDSLQIYLAALLDKYEETSEVGTELLKMKNLRNVRLKFVLVVKNAKDIAWLTGPMAELRARLLQFRKIWGIEVVVLNEELARQYKLICET